MFKRQHFRCVFSRLCYVHLLEEICSYFDQSSCLHSISLFSFCSKHIFSYIIIIFFSHSIILPLSAKFSLFQFLLLFHRSISLTAILYSFPLTSIPGVCPVTHHYLKLLLQPSFCLIHSNYMSATIFTVLKSRLMLLQCLLYHHCPPSHSSVPIHHISVRIFTAHFLQSK